MSEYTLFKRQKEIEVKLLAGSMVLNWDMRLGKTRAVLNAFDRLTFAGGPRTLIVICPSIGKGVWQNENREMGLDIPTIVLDGISNKRIAGDIRASEQLRLRMIIVNWEIADAHLPELQQLVDLGAVLVLDESHDHCCNPANARYKAVRDLALMADRVWMLTGTLYRTSALDLHWQLRLLGPEHYPFYYMKTSVFGEKFAYPKYNRFKKGWDYKGLRNEAELINLPVIDRRLEEMTELPDYIPWWLDEGEEWAYSGGDQEGALAKARSELSRLKAQRTVELIRRNNLHLESLVVFGWHKIFIREVAHQLGAAIIDGDTPHEQKTRIAREFAEHRIGIVVCNIQAAGKSVDLAASKNAVFGEIDWVQANMAQAEARIRGPKQLRKPCYWYLLTMNSVDEFVWRTMLARGRDMKRLDAAKTA